MITQKFSNKNIVRVLLFFFTGITTSLFAQSIADEEATQKQVMELLSDASIDLQKEQFPEAEAQYRKAISLAPKEEVGKYNLGNAYYTKELNDQALLRYKQAATVAQNKPEKHKAFHNMGNVFMKQKDYANAVEAYKNALRNNPTDDETRYNFALAKELLDKNPPPQPDENGEDENQDQKEDQKEEQKQNEGDNKDGDNKDQENEDKEGEEKEDKKEGENEKDKGKPNEPKDKKEEEGKQPQQPIPGKLSPQQVKSLLEAMNNEEKKVQDKVNAKKEKGAQVKTAKDW